MPLALSSHHPENKMLFQGQCKEALLSALFYGGKEELLSVGTRFSYRYYSTTHTIHFKSGLWLSYFFIGGLTYWMIDLILTNQP